jgi:chromosome segregation ATPase
MAYLPGFEHGIFISYSHVDDQDGWVELFQQESKAGNGWAAVLVETHLKDQLHALELGRALTERKIRLHLHSEGDEPVKSVGICEETLKRVRVDRLNEEIENVRMQIESCVSESQQASETTKILEKQAGFTSDPLQRLSLEQEHKLTLARIEECKRREQRLRERETQLNGQIQTEQSALNDVKDKMNSLERSLEVNQNSRRK